MLKIFTTQLFGVFRKIQENEENHLEDCARLIAQSIIGEGTIYIKGFDEMETISQVLIHSEEKIASVTPYHEGIELSPEDCLIVFTRNANDERGVKLLQLARTYGTSTVSVGAVANGQEVDMNPFHIDTKLLNGLVPDEDGVRMGYPPFMCALYIYYALYFNVSEMLEEYEM